MGFLKRAVTRQFLKFCLIGLESTILNYLVFLFFYYFLSSHYLLSAGIGFISGTIFGFFFNKVYSFGSRKWINRELPLYFLVYLFSLSLNLLLLKMIVTITPLGSLVSNVLLLPLMTLLNFIGSKIIAFQNKEW
jgi:putative flippase GtrA